MAIASLIEHSVAGQVLVNADNIGRTRFCGESGNLFLRDARGQKPGVKTMLAINATAQEVKRQPAPLVFVVCLIGEMPG
jgi:hypothetical protein